MERWPLPTKPGIWGVLVLLPLLFCSCRSFSQPSRGFLDELSTRNGPETPFLRREVQIDFETPMLEGSFEGVLIAKTGTEPSLRLQLFPDVGPKVLDLTATSEFIACDSEDADPFYCPLPSEERIPPSLPFLFAVTLLEHFATLDPTRVVGVRDWEEGHELELTPHSSGVEVRIFLRHDGSIAGRWFRYGRIRWRETAGNPLELEARGVHVVLETVTEEIESEIDSSLFRPPPAVQP